MNCEYRVKRITLAVSEDLHNALKKYAFVEGRSLSSITREALERFCVDRQIQEIKILDERSILPEGGK